MNNDINPNTEASKLYRELHKHFLLTKVLKDPVQININRKKILILHKKWKEAVYAEIEGEFLPQLLPLFGKHTYQVILFDTSSALNISLAILLTNYSVADYNRIMGQLYRLIEDYSDTHTCSVSTITVSYPLSQEHPLYSEITAGTIIWQRSDSN